MSMGEKIVAGVVAIALVTAFGLHATGIAHLTSVGSQQGARVLDTAIKP